MGLSEPVEGAKMTGLTAVLILYQCGLNTRRGYVFHVGSPLIHGAVVVNAGNPV